MEIKRSERAIGRALQKADAIMSACSVKDLEKTKQILLFSLEESAYKRIFYIVYSRHRILKPHVITPPSAVLKTRRRWRPA